MCTKDRNVYIKFVRVSNNLYYYARYLLRLWCSRMWHGGMVSRGRWDVCGAKGGCHQKCCCCLKVHLVFVISDSSTDSKYHAYTPKEILNLSTVLVLSESNANGAMLTRMSGKGWQACKICLNFTNNHINPLNALSNFILFHLTTKFGPTWCLFLPTKTDDVISNRGNNAIW